MKTHSGADSDLSKIASLTVFVSAVILIAIGIVVTVL